VLTSASDDISGPSPAVDDNVFHIFTSSLIRIIF